jgi:xanthine dehydrogenase molybdenum-binding subunit
MPEPFTQRVHRTYVGTYRPRTDGWVKASGQAEYLYDLAARMKGLLYAKVLRSPYPHARIVRMDTSRAEALPGVCCVLRFDDPEVAALRPTNNSWTNIDTVTYDRQYWYRYRDRRVLSDRVRWVGDEAGVVVAAETEALAEAALDMVEVEWEELPFVLDPLEAMKPGAPLIHPECVPEGNVLPGDEVGGPELFLDRGDLDRAMTEAPVVVEVEARHHRAEHSCLETRGCLVRWRDERLTCWTNSYYADQTRTFLADMLGLTLNEVRVMNHFVGGSFGRSATGEQILLIFTALLARRTGRPILFRHSRHEDFHDTRQPIDYWCRLGATLDGKIVAAHFKGLADAGAYTDLTMGSLKFVPKFEIAESMLAHVENLRMEGRAVYTNKIPGSCMRGVGNAQFNLVLGLALDELAEQLGLDPVDVALRNLGHAWEQLPSESLAAVVREGAERIGWSNRHPPGSRSLLEQSKHRGLGFSCHCTWHAPWQELARGPIQLTIKLNSDGTIILQAPNTETGGGSSSCAVFACAEAFAFLGVTPDQIRWIAIVDTDTGIKDQVTTDSSVSYVFAEVMASAAERVKEELLVRGAKLLHIPREGVVIVPGGVRAAGEDRRFVPFDDVLRKGDLVPIVVTESRELPPEVTGTPFAATFAEVEVDTATGEVDVVKLVVVHDCGTVMFASGAEAQQVGGQCIGLGEALTEEIVYDEATGVPLNFNWVDYHVPTMLDYPEVEPVLLEVWRGAGDYGACGMGEGTVSCTPRAISNAIYNAVGVRLNEIPITPDKVLAALREATTTRAQSGARRGRSRKVAGRGGDRHD